MLPVRSLAVSAVVSATLALLTLPVPSASAASTRDTFVKGFSKRTDDRTFKQGYCVCVGGSLNGRAGVIQSTSVATGAVEYFLLRCYASTFDRTTGDFIGGTPCDGTWSPLPK